MRRLLCALIVFFGLPCLAHAQTTTLTIPPISNVGVVVLPASGVNGAGVATCPQNLVTTSTDCLVLPNTTAATAGVTVQISPRLRFRGTAWDTAASQTVDFFIENLPATAATPTGTLKFGYSLNGAAATYPMTLTSAGVLAPLLAIRGIDGSASAPPYSFASGTGHGMYMSAGTNGPMIAAGGIDVALFDGGPDIDFRSDLTLRWSQNSTVSGATYDTGLKRSAAGIVKATNGGAGYGTFDGLSYQLSGVLLESTTAPTVTTAGSSPSVPSNNGTATFRVNVGTGGTATTIVLGMPTATTGWNCVGSNITAAAANRNPTGVLLEQSSTTAAVTMQYQTVATGAALAFVASDIVQINCNAF